MSESRSFPSRPYLAVSGGIIRDGKILIVRRAATPAGGLYTFPGGVVEAGETLTEALVREIREETALAIAPIGLAGHREVIARDGVGRVERHFVILSFAARWLSGEPVLNEELSEAHWLTPQQLAGLKTTDGLAEMVAAVFALAGRAD